MTEEEKEYARTVWSQRFEDFLKQKGKKCILFNTPVHCNLGDHLIASGAISFLKDMGIKNIFEVPTDDYKFAIDSIRNVDIKFPIFITGGGFVTDLWEEELNRVFDIIKSFPNNYIIMLPQTFYFTNDKKTKKYFDLAKDIFNRKKLIIFARERATLDLCRENFPKAKTYLSPDMAFYVTKESMVKNSNDNSIRTSLLVFREDKERESNIKKNVIKELNSLNIKYDFGTTIEPVKEKWIPVAKREEYLEKKFDEFNKYDLIITDRLHGMIFATILKKRCIAFNNLTRKVKNVYDVYLKNIPYVEFLDSYLLFENKLKQLSNIELNKIKYPKFKFLRLKLVILKLYWRAAWRKLKDLLMCILKLRHVI